MAVFVGTAAANGVPHIWATDEFGVSQHTFNTTDDVYAYGNFGCWDYPLDSARVYVVLYKDNWSEGDVLGDVSEDNYETVVYFSFFTEDPVWNAPLEPGEYPLVLDLEYDDFGVWSYLDRYEAHGHAPVYDPLWNFTVTGNEPEPIPEFSTIAIPVAAILGLLFFFNYRKHSRKG